MLRAVAVQRINDGIGFRPDGHSLEDRIISRLQEAQRDLEKGKTLPKFLLQRDATLIVTAGLHSVAAPTGFLRVSDETRLRYFSSGSDYPTFLERKLYIDAAQDNLDSEEDARAPSVYVIRRSNAGTIFDFLTTADTTYTIYLDYYKAAELLTSNIENVWLANGAEWLIGEAGYRIAKNLRDKDAITDFDDMRKVGRAAVLGEEIAEEEADGPFVMGANL